MSTPVRRLNHLANLMLAIIIFLATSLFWIGRLSAQTQTYNTPGTYNFTVPAGVTSITVKAWGAGGGGGHSDDGNSGNSAAGGGGGGGGYRTGALSVSAGQTITIVVGQGGTGGQTDGDNGTDGGNSSATHTSGTFTANGGLGGGAAIDASTPGTGGAGGSGSGGSGGFTGGAGANGGFSTGGRGGGGAGDANNGQAGSSGGAGGTAGGGNGGAPGSSGNGGSNGADYGGGGGGTGDDASGSDNGGDGGDGGVVLSWTCSDNISNMGTTAASPVCFGGTATVTVTSTTLAGGTFTVYYNLSGANTATAQSATMIFNGGANTGTFSTIALSNSGATTITITSVGCANVVAGQDFTSTFTVNAAVDYGTITSGDQTFCAGSQNPSDITFSTAPSGSGSFSYQWYYQDGIVACPSGSSTAGWNAIGGANASNYNPPSGLTASRTYACFVTPGGTPTCGTGAWASGCRQVTILPALSYGTVASGDETICTGGDPSNITLSVLPAGSGSFTYQWYFQNGLVACPTGSGTAGWTSIGGATASSYNPPAGLTGSRTYAVLVNPTGTPDCGSAAWATDCRKVTVVADPSAPTATKSPNVATVCAGQTLTLTGVTDNGGGAGTCNIEYRSSTNGGSTWTSWSTTLPSFAAVAGATNLIEVRKNCNGSGCDISASSSYSWAVNTPPSCSITGDDPVCAGTTGHVYSAPVGMSTYAWSIMGNGSIPGATNGQTVSIDAGAAGTYTVSVTITNGGCTSSCSKTVTVNANPTCSITGDDPVCANTTGHIYTGPAGMSSYSWGISGNGSIVGSTTGSAVTVTAGAAGTYTVSVTVTDANGCNSNCLKTVTINPRPTAGISGVISFCAGGSTVLTATGGGSYLWDDASTNAMRTITAGGTYTVQVTDANGCTDTETATVTENPLPTATISGNLSFCTGGSTTLTAGGGVSYLWDDASTNAMRTIGTIGTYTVQVTDGNGCTDTETATVSESPAATAEAGGPYTSCGTNPVNIAATASGPGSWSGGAGVFGNASNASTTYTPHISELGTSVMLTWTTNDPDGAGPCAAVSDVALVTVGGQEIDVKGNGVSIADGDNTPASADFTDLGWTAVAAGTVTRNFVIENTGSSSLTLSGVTPVTLSGANAGDFTVTMQPASLVGIGATTGFQIQFDPSAAGVRTATVNIASSDCDENPYTFDIQGKGTIPQSISVYGNGNQIANQSATASVADDTDFGSVSTGGGMVSHTFTINNIANGAPLSLTGVPRVTIADRDAADFTVTSQPSTPIEGGSSTTFTIKFQPGATGLRTAIVIITHDDLPQNPFVFTINGTGL